MTADGAAQSPEAGDASRYAAFISYSHADQATVRWLHHALETYRLPRSLVGTESPYGPVPRRLPPVFRDRDELPASGDLGEHLRAALAESRFQIVLCSPKAAKSHWVNEEILSFKRMHGEQRTLALIVSGEPYSSGDEECFPKALRFHLGPDGELSDVPAEPIAADIRPGKDGKRLALLKLIAGITGLRLDQLARRDAARRQRQMMWITAASMSIALLTIGLAIYAEGQRRVAVRQQRLAESSLDFLIGTFAIANPATENPRTITALSILSRASKRAADEFKDEPAIASRLLRATGEIYFNLGLPKEAGTDLRAALARTPENGEARARILLKLATIDYKRGELAATRATIDAASKAYPSNASYAPALDAAVMEQRGMAEVLAGHYAQSANILGEAATRYQALDGDRRQDLGRVWMSQGQALLRLQKYAEAEKLFARAETNYTEAFGRNHVLTANAFQNQALADFESGDAARASQRIAQAVAIYSKVLEGDHPTIGAALILQGRIRTARSDYRGALQVLDQARALYGRLYGPRNPAVGDADFYAAEAEAKGGNVDGALARLARTKSIYDENYGATDPDQAELMMVRSRILAAAGRKAEARQDCDSGAAILAKIDPADPALGKARATCAALTVPS
jgi:tetratricopeptide (TPR) repeat protein